jgi:hypothetical protein
METGSKIIPGKGNYCDTSMNAFYGGVELQKNFRAGLPPLATKNVNWQGSIYLTIDVI